MTHDQSHPGGMSAPIVVHGLSPSGGRRVTINGQIVGLAHDDRDLVEFLRRAASMTPGTFSTTRTGSNGTAKGPTGTKRRDLYPKR